MSKPLSHIVPVARLLLSSLALLPLSFSAQGQTDSVLLNEVRISAVRRLSDAGLQTSILDSTLLHQNISLSMADILGKHSTLFVKTYGRATESTAEFRGTSPSHTQATWNGMRVNSPMLGTVDFSYIPAHFVDQATLLHGASSLVATSGGLGGAIELQSLPPENQGFCLQYVQGVGSYSTFDQFLRFAFADERWATSTRVAYSKSDNDFKYTNHDKMIDVRDASGKIISSYHPTERNKSGYFDDVNVLHDLFYNDGRGNRIGASLWYAYSLRGLPFLSVDYKEDNDFTNEHRRNALNGVVSWTHTRSSWSTVVRGGYAWNDIAYHYFTTRDDVSTDITHSQSLSNTGFVQASARFLPSSSWQLSANAALYYTHVRSWDRSPFHIGDNYSKGRTESNFTLSAQWRPIPRLTLSALLRQEHFQHRLVPPIPAFFADVVLYRPWNLVFKASVARNHRHPTMDDLYFQPGGNPNLQPEQGFTYDGGLQLTIQKPRYTLTVNASAFDSHISDWILWTPNAKGYWQPSNVKKVHSYGSEVTGQADIQFSRNWNLFLLGNFAFTPSINQGEGVNSNDASRGKQLCYVPRISANATLRLSWRHWTLSYTWTHYSERFTTTSNQTDLVTGRLKPYYMSDLALQKLIPLRRCPISLKAVVNNLLGTDYVTVLSRPMAGRNFEIFLEITPRWSKKSK